MLRSPLTPDREPGVRTSVRTVLLVGSSRDDCAMYAAYLRLNDVRAVQIHNTADALALGRTADAIVTGLRVPGPFDGIELIRRLRADCLTRDKAIVVLTACAFEDDRQQAFAAGCDAILVKPCPPEILLEEVRAHANRDRRDIA